MPGRATAAAGDFLIALDAPVSVELTASGAGGLDAGTEASETWYAVHVIGDTSGVNPASALLSTSPDSPTLPGGYDRFRRVGWVRNNAAADIIPFWHRGKGTRRTCFYNTETQGTRLLDQGNATTWTTIDASTFVPPTCQEAYLGVCFAGLTGTAADRLYLRPLSGAAEMPHWLFQHPTSSWPGITRLCFLPTDDLQRLEYRVDNADSRAFVDVAGFVDEL